VVGINPAHWNTRSSGKGFVRRYGLTFTNLWDGSDAVYRRYGSPYTSRALLVDKTGNRVEDTAVIFSASKFQRLVDRLE
jgi:hypothetical protein